MAIARGFDHTNHKPQLPAQEKDKVESAHEMGLSRATRRKMRQNLWWAAGYNVLAFPLAAGVLYRSTGWLLSPELAALSMSGSTLIVVANALLLKRVKMNTLATVAAT